uniref:Metalloendopeptidase n=1 Tax=Ditylenchus dipsaci TaxID=166011 RepID=A0A915DKK2_9BILA
MPTKRWDVSQPIPVYFDDNVANYERQMVHQAHQMIQASTCIRFQTNAVKPVGSHIYYAKIPSPTSSVAVHETMHALGMNHEHLRNDRDDYIDVQWSNINPQFYDYFAIADSSKFTPYDYGSIMHYNAFTAAIDSSKPTMLPKQNRAVNQPIMGQRKRLGDRDVQMLNTMYCRPNCEDKNVYCGVWALRNLCNTRAQTGWMTQNCRKSCQLC